MNFDDLFGNDLSSYLDGVFQPRKMLFYMHIPKCAGTSSVKTLVAAYSRCWHFQFDRIDEQFPIFIDRAKNDSEGPFELAAGHFLSHHLQDVQKNQVPHHAITFFRHPIARVVSEYRYICTPAHPFSEQVLSDYPTFEAFVERRLQPNAIAHILFGGVCSFDEYVEKLKQNFCFVGLSEFYHLSMALLMKAQGNQYVINPRKNVTVETEHNTFELSQKTYQSLCQSQSLDLQVFEYLFQRYAKLSEKVFSQMLEGSVQF